MRALGVSHEIFMKMHQNPYLEEAIQFYKKQFSRMRVSGNRDEFQLKARRIKFFLNFMKCWWILCRLVLFCIDEFLSFSFDSVHSGPRSSPMLQKLKKYFFFSRSKKWVKIAFFGQNRIFRSLSEIFLYFLGRCSGNFKFLGRDGGAFYPKEKRESKNSSIQARKSRDKSANFLMQNQRGLGLFRS